MRVNTYIKKATLFTLLGFFYSCTANSQYPIEIERLGLEKQYDITKWYLYCISCDQKLEKIDSNITIGQLPLKFKEVIIHGDTTELHFSFYFKNRLININEITKPPYKGVMFINDTIYAFLTYGDAYYYRLDDCSTSKCPYREGYPQQKEVIDYIKDNKEDINIWFKNAAIKKGIIDE